MPILLFLLWLVLNGKVTLEIVLFGLAIDALVILAMRRLLNYSLKREMLTWRKAGLLAAYLGVLVWEVIKANLKVALVVLDRRRKVTQAIVYVTIPLKTDFCKMLLANSITLTPGTITASVDGDTYTIHCLSREMIEGIEQSTFVRLLRKMEA